MERRDRGLSASAQPQWNDSLEDHFTFTSHLGQWSYKICLRRLRQASPPSCLRRYHNVDSSMSPQQVEPQTAPVSRTATVDEKNVKGDLDEKTMTVTVTRRSMLQSICVVAACTSSMIANVSVPSTV